MTTGSAPGYDVIGDVHGCNEELLALLLRMGYCDASGTWRHQSRQAVFVGDLIDRGPAQCDVIRTVRPMVETGAALIVLGNHEMNAMAYAAPDPDVPGAFLRRHGGKNDAQHQAFLTELPLGSADHREAIDWFATMPLWLDLDELRVVHACWDPDAIDGLGDDTIDSDRLVAASREGSDEFRWVEMLCKGPEVQLPENFAYRDKDGIERDRARYRWWDSGTDTYATACEVPMNVDLPDIPIELPPVVPYGGHVPVLFGHYWREYPSLDITKMAGCVDYSAVRGGPLVAYRWSGEQHLDPRCLVTSREPCS